jgi:hypothetical protein
MTNDYRYPEEVQTNGTRRIICRTCPYCYLEAPRRVAHICAHPDMWRRFDVTPFVARKEAPQRCPMEVQA